jgi:O-antigen ligase
LAVYALISIASTFWSVYPSWTLYKSLEYLVDIALLGAVLATVPSVEAYKSLFDWTWVLLSGLLATVWLGAFLWPDKAFPVVGGLIPVRIAGVLPALDQNDVGQAAAILAIAALSRMLFRSTRRRQIFYWVVLTCSGVTLVLSQTRAAIVGFVLGAALVLFLTRRVRLMSLLALTIFMLILFTNFTGVSGMFWQRGENEQTIEEFSGRLPVWELGWEKFLKQPIIGFGAYAGGRFVVTEGVVDPRWSSTLSDYIETMVGTGLCGLIPIIFVVVGTWWLLIRGLRSRGLSARGQQLTIEGIGVLAIITIRSFLSVNIIWHPAVAFILIVGYAEFLRRNRQTLKPCAKTPV